MVRHAVLAGLTAGMCVVGIVIGCSKDSNPAGHEPSEIIGTWTGIRDTQIGGSACPDTYAIYLSFPSAANYTMTRGRVKYASSPTSPAVDSMRETGTWVISGNNVVLTPDSCGHMYPSYQTEFETIDCSSIPLTGTIPIAITNNRWTFRMVEWVNGDTIRYTVTKSYLPVSEAR